MIARWQHDSKDDVHEALIENKDWATNRRTPKGEVETAPGFWFNDGSPLPELTGTYQNAVGSLNSLFSYLICRVNSKFGGWCEIINEQGTRIHEHALENKTA